MVAAPYVAVIFEDVFGRDAERRLPGDAVSGAVGHDQIRNETRTETTVDILALEHPGHRPLAVLWIRQPGQPTDELFPQRFVGGTRFDDAVLLAPLEIHVDVAQAHRVRA